MDEHVVNPADEIPAIPFIIFRCLLRAQAIEETDLAQDYRVGGLEKALANPAEYSVRLKEALGTSGNQRASAGYWAVIHLLIQAERTDAAFLVALCASLSRTRCAADGTQFAFGFGKAKSFGGRDGFEPRPIPLADGISAADFRFLAFGHAPCLARALWIDQQLVLDMENWTRGRSIRPRRWRICMTRCRCPRRCSRRISNWTA